MPPAPLLQPLALPSCSWPCSPPPPQGRWPVCAERGACAPSLPHFPTSPLPHFPTSPLIPPPSFCSSSSFSSSLRPFGTPFSRVPRRAALHSSAPPSPLPRSSAHAFLPAPFFSSSTFPSSLRPFGTPFSRVHRRATLPSAPPLIHSSPPSFFLLPLFFGSSAHSEPRSPAFTAVRHSHPLLRSSISTSPLLYSCVPPRPFFSSSTFPSSLRPFGTPFSRVHRRATLPSAPSRLVLTDNRERGRQPCRRSRRTKKSGPHGPDSIGYQSVFQKKREITSRAYECSHPT